MWYQIHSHTYPHPIPLIKHICVSTWVYIRVYVCMHIHSKRQTHRQRKNEKINPTSLKIYIYVRVFKCISFRECMRLYAHAHAYIEYILIHIYINSDIDQRCLGTMNSKTTFRDTNLELNKVKQNLYRVYRHDGQVWRRYARKTIVSCLCLC